MSGERPARASRTATTRSSVAPHREQERRPESHLSSSRATRSAQERLKCQVADQDALVHIVVPGRDFVVLSSTSAARSCTPPCPGMPPEPVRVCEAYRMAVGELRRRAHGSASDVRIASESGDGYGDESLPAHHGGRPTRRSQSASTSAPAGAVAHLGEHLLLVVPGEHTAVHLSPRPEWDSTFHGPTLLLWTMVGEKANPYNGLDHVRELDVAARELGQGFAPPSRVAQALAPARESPRPEVHEFLRRAHRSR